MRWPQGCSGGVEGSVRVQLRMILHLARRVLQAVVSVADVCIIVVVLLMLAHAHVCSVGEHDFVAE